ncbi:MAG: Crp/Fnr family transcriptional regulator [Solirubrobacteraceae bacterium]
MAVAPTPIETCRLLDEDPDLAEALPNGRRERATEELTAPCIHVAAGRWVPPELDPTGIGMVVISGVLLRHVAIDGRVGIELTGETDVIRPWQGSDSPTLSLSEEWSALMPARLAWLDERCGSVIARYPELTNRLLERAVRRSRHLVTNLAIVHQPRVDTRLWLLLWQLAGRWGKVRPDGVHLPLKLTHAMLADFVAARRPTVTSALSELSRRNLVRSADEGWLLLGDPPALADDPPSALVTTIN